MPAVVQLLCGGGVDVFGQNKFQSVALLKNKKEEAFMLGCLKMLSSLPEKWHNTKKKKNKLQEE